MSTKTESLSRERLQDLLSYDPLTGLFTWRFREDAPKEWNTVWAGRTAGTPKDGYVSVCIDGVVHRAHRLAFLYMEGFVPPMIDHDDRDRANNRWKNLRAATRSQNFANSGTRKDNISGVRGVSWHAQSKRWRARLNVNGTLHNLGLFKSKDDAAAAYRAAAAVHFGEFAPSR